MDNYLELIDHIYSNGEDRTDRTGVGTRSVFGATMQFDLQEGFPLLTAKKTHFKSVLHELLWFLSGSTNIKYLQENGVKIWDAWSDEDGNLGPVYGKQWRDFGGVDQISEVVDSVKENPHSRRHIVSAWNPTEVKDMALPPCHMFFQFYVRFDQGVPTTLDCQMYQRSADMFLGVPFNIASYALLTAIIATECGLKAGKLNMVLGDAHIYNNHFPQVEKMLDRCESNGFWAYPDLPKLAIKKRVSIFDYEFDDFKLIGYEPLSTIKAPVAV